MSDEQDTMISPGLEALLEKVDSKFTLVSLAAKRSRQLIAYDLGLGEGGGITTVRQQGYRFGLDSLPD